jgi:hypothetical protein
MENDKAGIWIGIFTFIAGITLLMVTFVLAYNLYNQPIEPLLGIKNGAIIDTSKIGTTALHVFSELILKSLMLLVMSIIGGFIAHRGIKLYLAARKP